MNGLSLRLGGFVRHAPRRRSTALTDAWRSVATLVYRSPLYRLVLSRTAPPEVNPAAADPWPGDAGQGTAILHGTFAFQGQSFEGRAGLWAPVGAHAAWRAEQHGFAWLRDLAAVGGDAARSRARDLVADWLARAAGWDALTWRSDVLGNRLAAWLGHYGYLTDGAPDRFRPTLDRALVAQARHLQRVAAGGSDGAARFAALKGLVHANWSLRFPPRTLERRRGHTLKLLSAELTRQVHGDGGHFERSPSLHLCVLRDLIEIRAVLRGARAEPPIELQSAIDRMAPFLRYMRHGDGGLALFNDSNEEVAADIDAVLGLADAKGKPPVTAPHSGFQRLTAERTLIVVDAGAPAELDGHAHAGTLAFEMSVGKERLVVNCGAHVADQSDWRRVQRATAAHSTVTIDDTNSSEILGPAGPLSGTLGQRPRQVACQRDDAEGSIWLDLSHDGYVRQFGVTHRRRLFLSAGGDDLRGEDTLVGEGHGRYAIRFHLHPRVQASLVQDGSAALLRLPSGLGWRLRANAGTLMLGDSIYLGRRGEMKRAQQIIVWGLVEGRDPVIKWALRREGGK
ncbi:MAG: heparinase II/III family protein [Proteobacteria bacterium]|nr:heparinase II/III family protein [Pseudomonadota bacterium]